MSDKTRIDLERVEREGHRLEQAGERFSEALHALKSTLAQHEGCWGEDDIGKGFAQKYVKPAEQNVDNSEAAHRSVDEAAGKLRDGGRTLANTDRDSAARVRGAGEHPERAGE